MIYGQRPALQADSHRPEATNPFELKRWVTGIATKEFIASSSFVLHG